MVSRDKHDSDAREFLRGSFKTSCPSSPSPLGASGREDVETVSSPENLIHHPRQVDAVEGDFGRASPGAGRIAGLSARNQHLPGVRAGSLSDFRAGVCRDSNLKPFRPERTQFIKPRAARWLFFKDPSGLDPLVNKVGWLWRIKTGPSGPHEIAWWVKKVFPLGAVAR